MLGQVLGDRPTGREKTRYSYSKPLVFKACPGCPRACEAVVELESPLLPWSRVAFLSEVVGFYDSSLKDQQSWKLRLFFSGPGPTKQGQQKSDSQGREVWAGQVKRAEEREDRTGFEISILHTDQAGEMP